VPDIDEGLEIGGEPVISREEGDVNTQSGFEAGIARALTGEAAAPEEGEGEAAPEEEEVQAPEAPEGPAPEEPEDNWRERYEEAQKLIDRQGNELGALRAQVQEIWSAQQAPQTPSTGPFNAEAMLDEYGGQQTIHWAIDSAPEHIEEVARAWALSGDPEGAVFYADYRAEQARLEYTQAEQQQPEPDPALNEVAQERKLVQVFKEAREHDPGFSSYEPGIPAALQSTDTPDEIKLMLMSGNLDHMRAGVRHLIPYARLAAIDAGTATQTPSAEPPAEATPQEEARREAARKTAIVTGSQRLQAPGEQPTSGEMTSEQRIARFKEQFDAEPDTSIAAGLTINGQPVLPQRPKRPA
jgi:hypothetical protein